MTLDHQNAGEILNSKQTENGEWQTVILALEDTQVHNGQQHILQEGDVYIGPANQIQGTHWSMNQNEAKELLQTFPEPTPITVPREERNEAGFYFGNLSGHPYEIKLDENTPNYPESPPHKHQVPETYLPINGEITMATPGENYPENPKEAAKITSQIQDYTRENIQENYPRLFQYQEIDTAVRVPANTLHYIESATDNLNLMVARGDGQQGVTRSTPTQEGFQTQNYLQQAEPIQ